MSVWATTAAAAVRSTAASQGFILRRARGVSAWTRSLVPLVFLPSALVSGSGLLGLVEAGAGRRPGGALLLLLALDTLAWGRAGGAARRGARQATPGLA